MPDNLSDDVLDGVKDFSDFLGRDKFPPRRIHHLINRGLLPAGRIGRRIIGSKAALRKHIAALTGAEGAE
jgi:hypothetical protein